MTAKSDNSMNTIPCLIMKDDEGIDVLATLVPRVDGKGYWLEFPIEPPFDVLLIGEQRVDVPRSQ